MSVKPAGFFILIEGLLSLVLSPLNCSPPRPSQDIGEALVHRPHDAEHFGDVPLRGLQFQLHGCPGPAASAVPQSPERALRAQPTLSVAQMDS